MAPAAISVTDNNSASDSTTDTDGSTLSTDAHVDTNTKDVTESQVPKDQSVDSIPSPASTSEAQSSDPSADHSGSAASVPTIPASTEDVKVTQAPPSPTSSSAPIASSPTPDKNENSGGILDHALAPILSDAGAILGANQPTGSVSAVHESQSSPHDTASPTSPAVKSVKATTVQDLPPATNSSVDPQTASPSIDSTPPQPIPTTPNSGSSGETGQSEPATSIEKPSQPSSTAASRPADSGTGSSTTATANPSPAASTSTGSGGPSAGSTTNPNSPSGQSPASPAGDSNSSANTAPVNSPAVGGVTASSITPPAQTVGASVPASADGNTPAPADNDATSAVVSSPVSNIDTRLATGVGASPKITPPVEATAASSAETAVPLSSTISAEQDQSTDVSEAGGPIIKAGDSNPDPNALVSTTVAVAITTSTDSNGLLTTSFSNVATALPITATDVPLTFTNTITDANGQTNVIVGTTSIHGPASTISIVNSKPGFQTAAIGGIVGGVLFLLLAGAAAVFFVKKRSRKQMERELRYSVVDTSRPSTTMEQRMETGFNLRRSVVRAFSLRRGSGAQMLDSDPFRMSGSPTIVGRAPPLPLNTSVLVSRPTVSRARSSDPFSDYVPARMDGNTIVAWHDLRQGVSVHQMKVTNPDPFADPVGPNEENEVADEKRSKADGSAEGDSMQELIAALQRVPKAA